MSVASPSDESRAVLRRRYDINTQVSSPSQQNLRCARKRKRLSGFKVSSTVSTRRVSRLPRWLISITTLAFGVPLSSCRKSKEDSSEDGYGTGDQVLYSPKLSQACEVDPAGPTGQGP